MSGKCNCDVVFASYDTWMTDTDIDADCEPPLEPDGPWQVCVSLW